MAGPCEGHVGQAALLAQALAPEGLLVGAHRLSQEGLVRDSRVEVPHGEGGQVAGVGPQREGEGGGGAHPAGLRDTKVVLDGAGVGGEDLLVHAGDGDDVPLQALGGVDGEELDRPGRGLDLGGAHGVLVLLGGVEPFQEAGEGGGVGVGGEGPGRLVEGVEGTVPHRVTDPGGDLDVEVEDLLGQGHEVGQGQRDGLPDASDRPGGAQGNSPPGLGQVPGRRGLFLLFLYSVLMPSQQGVQGLAEQWGVGLGIVAVSSWCFLAAFGHGAGELAGQRHQGPQVAGTDAETSQEPDHPVPALRVRGHGQQGANVGDLGDVEHPAQANDRVRQAGLLQLSGNGLHLRPSAAQDGHLGTGRPALGKEGDDCAGLLGGVLEEGPKRRPGLQAEGLGAGPQGGDGEVLAHRVPVLDDAGAQRRGDDVGDLQDGGVVAPGGRQLQDGGGLSQ